MKKIIKKISIQSIKNILSGNLDKINDLDVEGNTLLHYAVIEQNYEVVNYLLELGARDDIFNKNGLVPIQLACMGDSINILDSLFKCSLNLNNLNLLHFSSAVGKSEIVKYLIIKNINVNELDENDRTPLHWAAQEGFLEIAKLLIDNKADINVLDNEDQSVLYLASAEGHLEMVELLLNHGGLVDFDNRISPLMIACAYECYNIINVLLNAGANINFKDNDGRTALFYAIVYGNIEMEKYLIDNGADLNIKDNFGISIGDIKTNISIRNKLYEELF